MTTRPIKQIAPDQKRGLPFTELERLLRKWQKILRLEEWQINLEIVDFLRADFRQSGDFRADPTAKTATILLTWDPFRNEEKTILHELVHVTLWDLDRWVSDSFVKNEADENLYLEKLESTVEQLTEALWQTEN